MASTSQRRFPLAAASDADQVERQRTHLSRPDRQHLHRHAPGRRARPRQALTGRRSRAAPAPGHGLRAAAAPSTSPSASTGYGSAGGSSRISGRGGSGVMSSATGDDRAQLGGAVRRRHRAPRRCGHTPRPASTSAMSVPGSGGIAMRTRRPSASQRAAAARAARSPAPERVVIGQDDDCAHSERQSQRDVSPEVDNPAHTGIAVAASPQAQSRHLRRSAMSRPPGRAARRRPPPARASRDPGAAIGHPARDRARCARCRSGRRRSCRRARPSPAHSCRPGGAARARSAARAAAGW